MYYSLLLICTVARIVKYIYATVLRLSFRILFGFSYPAVGPSVNTQICTWEVPHRISTDTQSIFFRLFVAFLFDCKEVDWEP
jgi:hypothetical protein